jgi:putative ABC transport system permease protein
MDARARPLDLPPEGLVISAKLAEVIGAGVGDMLTVEVLDGRRPTRQVVVAALLDDFTDPAAYMRLDALHRMLWEGPTVSGAFLAIDTRYEPELFRQLKGTPRVAGVSMKSSVLQTFRSTLAENLTRMRLFNIVFASVIACGVVYNSARISLAERSRDLATLRVLGFTRTEVSRILFGEFALLTMAAIPLGLYCGYGFAWLMTVALDTETQRFPLVVLPRTYGYAALVTVIAGAASALTVRRRLDKLDLIAVLKAHD